MHLYLYHWIHKQSTRRFPFAFCSSQTGPQEKWGLEDCEDTHIYAYIAALICVVGFLNLHCKIHYRDIHSPEWTFSTWLQFSVSERSVLVLGSKVTCSGLPLLADSVSMVPCLSGSKVLKLRAHWLMGSAGRPIRTPREGSDLRPWRTFRVSPIPQCNRR